MPLFGRRGSGLVLAAVIFATSLFAQDASVLRQVQDIGRKAQDQLRQVQLDFDRQRLEARDEARGRIAELKRGITPAAMQRDGSVVEAQYALAEAEAELQWRTIPLIDAAQTQAENAIQRQRVADETAVHARTLDVGDEDQNRQMREYLSKSVKIEQRWQERFDALSHEWELARIELQREERQAHNLYDREVARLVLQIQEDVAAGRSSSYGVAGDPRLAELEAQRDEKLNAIARRLDEAQLEHDSQRAEAESQKEAELAEIAPY
ncbi:hypothetical protein [Actomonas aquatica]|uniref:Uncharacterized protein n=1 Tax=Actomonas aquatica TaxID=2866162 RepID=A0ABZ1C344_9BACT|nr:hypothetical protein [Opitutus sp. WL0086]WRQ85628.1 hypothetical protein K1X11_012520 [Opitutus sp. WL0086]